jgi:BioD-like phosphotransacetylase family protein
MSTTRYSGKTVICLGLALRFKDEGYSVGYFKPLGWHMTHGPNGEPLDEDALMLKEALQLKAPLDEIVPNILGDRFLEEVSRTRPEHYQRRISEAYKKASKGKDIMILGGPPTLGSGSSAGIDPCSLVKEIGAKVLLTSRVDNDVAIDEIIRAGKNLKQEKIAFIGAILNHIPRLILERCKGLAVPVLRRQGIDVLGLVPEEPLLKAPSVQDIHESLGGTILAGKRKLSNLVEEILVGAMTPESALTYFRRSMNKAVITGGDRSDIQLMALQTSTSVLILTGNLYPDVRVVAAAEESNTPVLLVPYDTYTTVMMISKLTGRIKPGDSEKINLAKKLVEEHVDWKRILKSLVDRGQKG